MRGRWIFLCAFAVGVLATILLLHPPVSSQDWAAWFQAVGAVVGIGIAIAVPLRIHAENIARDSRREADAVRHDLQSFRDELDVSFEGMQRTISTTITDEFPDGIYHYVVRPDVNGAVVYNSIADRVGRIPQSDLRREIVRTYGLLQALVLDFHNHANLWDALILAEARKASEPTSVQAVQAWKEARSRLIQISGSLQNSYIETMRELGALVAKIDAVLAGPEDRGDG